MFSSNTSQAQASQTYVDDVFSTYLYTGNGSTQTINNGIDLAGKGGLVWIKLRSGPNAVSNHVLFDTVRGAGRRLYTNTTDAEFNGGNILTAFTSSGFTIDASIYNDSSNAPVSWTFRKAAKFFDVVTYTGTGANRTIAHNLGSAPRFMVVKRTDTTGSWCTYHSDLGATQIMFLNTTAAASTDTRYWNSTNPTSTVFSVGTDGAVNASGGTYVAYLFASDAGGFGTSNTDNVISCGSFISSGGVDTINLGYEPQWVLYKCATNLSDWRIADTMRGMSIASNTAILFPNQSSAEQNAAQFVNPTATGFQLAAGATISGETYIYIAIRRGPMKVPTSGTSVYTPVTYTGNGVNGTVVSTTITPDLSIPSSRSNVILGSQWYDRLRGNSRYLLSPSTNAEATDASNIGPTGVMNGFVSGSYSNVNAYPYVLWNFQRAPGFFDEVCYTGTGSATTQAHNLGVVPELMIVKERSAANNWWVYDSTDGNTKYSVLNSTATPVTSSTAWNNTTPTSSVFSIGTAANVNASAQTYVAYLFATLAGISKVGSYTGNGTSQTIDCGFAAGARFILIKRTDSTGDWYVWDSARGIVSGNDPHSSLNTTAAEVTTDDSIDPDSTGFIVNQVAATNINVNAATYIYLAIA